MPGKKRKKVEVEIGFGKGKFMFLHTLLKTMSEDTQQGYSRYIHMDVCCVNAHRSKALYDGVRWAEYCVQSMNKMFNVFFNSSLTAFIFRVVNGSNFVRYHDVN